MHHLMHLDRHLCNCTIVARSFIDSFLLTFEEPPSMIAILSAEGSTVAIVVNSFKSNASDTVPDVPPPDKPSPPCDSCDISTLVSKIN